MRRRAGPARRLGRLTPHGEFTPATFAFGPTKQAFFQDQTLHFQVTANSLNAFPFAKSRIITVEAQDKTPHPRVLML